MTNSSKINPVDVRRDLLTAYAGTIIEPVPLDRRGGIGPWRAADLGSIVLNRLRGREDLNAGPDPVVHFHPDYDEAVRYGRELADGSRQTQFDAVAKAVLEERLGYCLGKPTIIILGLSGEGQNLPLQDASLGQGDGLVYEGYLQPEHIDPYARLIIGHILGQSGIPRR